MAARYWVGGTETWNTTAGTKWALTSGGVGGQAVPTAADDVYFDAASGTSVVTISGTANGLSLNCTGFTGALAGTGTLSIRGNFTLVATMTFSFTGILTFTGASATGTYNINLAGKSINNTTGSNSSIQTGNWNLLSDFTVTGTTGLTINTIATFNTNNWNITLNADFNLAATSGTINLGSSTITLNSTQYCLRVTSTGHTLNAGTSTIIINNAISPISTIGFAGGGKTFYNVHITSTQVGTFSFTGTNTFNNLSIAGKTNTAGVSNYLFENNQTINGTFTVSSGTDISYRALVSSNTLGTNRTITAAAVSLTNVDFRNITGAGAASWTGTSIGNATGNVGITFDTAKLVYWNLSGTQNWNATGWATSSGGTPAVANFPLPQDTAIFDDTGSVTGTITVNSSWNVGGVDMGARTLAMTLTTPVAFSVYGSWTNGTGTTLSNNFPITFAAQNSTIMIRCNGVQFTQPLIINAPNGIVRLGDDYVSSGLTGTLTLTNGTFDANNYNVNFSSVSLGAGTKTLLMGTGTWSLRNTSGLWNMSTNQTGLTFSGANAPITFTNVGSSLSKSFQAGAGLTYNKITIGGVTGGNNSFVFSGASTFLELASVKTVAYTITFAAGGSCTIGTWSITGTSGNVVTVTSSVAGSTSSLAITNKTTGIDYLAIRDIDSTNRTPVTFWAGANSTNTGNNLGVAFADGTTTQAYILTSGTSFTTPTDWNNASNNIYLFGGGGGGSGSNITLTNRAAGGGGGGGGFRLLSNQTISGAISYAIGAGGTAGAAGTGALVTAGTGGTTTWNTTNTATGGTGGSSKATAPPASTGGTGGTGTSTGGTGGVGGTTTTSLMSGGGAGAGAAGVNGAGANGGNGVSGATTTTTVTGGGGGGNGGGTAGGDGTTTLSGAGGNNSLGTGGGVGRTTAGAGNAGILGGGGSGSFGSGTRGGVGGHGADILSGFGSGGGSGGSSLSSNTSGTAGLYGAGGGGAGINNSGFSGAAGAQGAIIIVYTLGGGPPITVNSNFFFLFG